MADKRIITVKFGGEEYTLPRLRYQEEKAVRVKIQAFIEPLIAQLGAGPVTELDNVDDLIAVVNVVKDVALNSMDTMLDMIKTYAPTIDWAAVEPTIYSDEIVTAFVEVVKSLFPFEDLVRSAVSSLSGLAFPQTSKN